MRTRPNGFVEPRDRRVRPRRRGAVLATILALTAIAGFEVVPAAADNLGCVSGTCTDTFLATGAVQQWTVPTGVTSAVFSVDGGQGGTDYAFSQGGLGGQVSGTLAVTPGEVFNLEVGGQGDPGASGSGDSAGGYGGGGIGGGASLAAGGGGGSFVFSASALVFVAGGGGGGSFDTGDGGYGGQYGAAGQEDPGGLAHGGGGADWGGSASCTPGAGGTTAFSSYEGAAGSGPATVSAGTLTPGIGGAGGLGGGYGGGGGGGGYCGGGGGSSIFDGTGGGGGTDYVAPAATSVAVTDAANSGAGVVTISYADVVATTTTLDAASPTTTVGGSESFTATVTPVPDSGSVAFLDGATPISGCTAQSVDSVTGVATCVVSFSTVGPHSVSANFSGSSDAEFTASGTASPTVVTVAAPLGSGPSTLSMVQGSVDPFLIDERRFSARVACHGQRSCAARVVATIKLGSTGRTVRMTSARVMVVAGRQSRIQLSDSAALRASVRSYLRAHRGVQLWIHLQVRSGQHRPRMYSVELRTLPDLR
jgi:hypothetical protein